MTLIARLAEVGKSDVSSNAIGDLGNGIYELKRHPYRVACFFIGNKCLLTHVFRKKKGDAYVVKEKRKAVEIRDVHTRSSKKEGR
jgi:hypothetical protein